MPDPFRAIGGVLGSFADWVGDSNAEYFAYRRFGPHWKEELEAQAQERQLSLDRLRNLRDISAEDLKQEKTQTFTDRGEFAGSALTALPDAAQREFLARMEGEIGPDTIRSYASGEIGDEKLANAYVQFIADQKNREAAEDFATKDAIEQLAEQRAASAALTDERAQTERELRPEQVRSERALGTQRQTAADVNVERVATEKQRKIVQDLTGQIKELELAEKRGEAATAAGDEFRKRAKLMIGGDSALEDRLVGIASEMLEATGREGLTGFTSAGRIEDIPSDVFPAAVLQLDRELERLGAVQKGRSTEATPQATLPDLSEDERDELIGVVRGLQEQGVPPEEWPPEVRRMVERVGRASRGR